MHSEPPKYRVLIEGSKLTDERMDGIKRYVTGLLDGLRNAQAEDIEIDVLVINRIVSLEEALSGGDGASARPATPSDGRSKKRRHVVFGFVGLWVPQVVLPAVRWVLPDWFCRRVLGKPKSTLVVPRLDVSAGTFMFLLVPPILHPLLARRLRTPVFALWRHGVFQMPPPPFDLSSYDLIHVPLPNVVHAVPVSDTPLMVTVHDLSFVACPQFLDRANRVTLSVGLRTAVNKGATFLSVSEATREQMLHHYDIAPERVTTVLNGCSSDTLYPVTDPTVLADVRSRYGIPEGPFLLTLSTIEPRKNLDNAVRAFVRIIEGPSHRDSDLHLVVAGGAGWQCEDVMHLSTSSGARIRLIGYVADEHLAALYSSAVGFVYPSHYEGFGLPLVEAMKCGVPVVYGRNSAMPEVVGEAGLAVDSNDVDDIARQMARLVDDEGFRDRMAASALERAATFSWDRAARETLDAYRRVSTSRE